ncbi:MAG: hypothetical protein WA919_03565 [Coleofasciculaceae cyanobacterium]
MGQRISPTLLKLAQAAKHKFTKFELNENEINLEINGKLVSLQWPPGPIYPKDKIPELVKDFDVLAACPTQKIDKMLESHWFPGCIKPNVGSRGRGFSIYKNPVEREAIVSKLTNLDMIEQPLLSGSEYRLTLCGDGTYAMALLVDSKNDKRLWRDATLTVERPLLLESFNILDKLKVPFIGFDFIFTNQSYYLLDINLSPSLLIHLATDIPRDLTLSMLYCWIDNLYEYDR